MQTRQLEELESLRRALPPELLSFDLAELEEAAFGMVLAKYGSLVAGIRLDESLDWCLALWELEAECAGTQRKHAQLLDLGWELVGKALNALRSNRSKIRQLSEQLVASNGTDADIARFSNGVIESNLYLLKLILWLQMFLCGLAHRLWPKADLGWLQAQA